MLARVATTFHTCLGIHLIRGTHYIFCICQGKIGSFCEQGQEEQEYFFDTRSKVTLQSLIQSLICRVHRQEYGMHVVLTYLPVISDQDTCMYQHGQLVLSCAAFWTCQVQSTPGRECQVESTHVLEHHNLTLSPIYDQ